MHRLLQVSILLFLVAVSATGRVRAVDTRQMAMSPKFRSIIVCPVDMTGSLVDAPPVISLDGNEAIAVTFDHITDERVFLRYELIHCDASWQPEGLVDSEFLDGFNQAEADDYAYSQGTVTHYINYRITIPNEQMRPTLPGNYLLRLYAEDAPDTTLLQARFSISENSTRVDADVTSRTDFDYNNRHQQLSIGVDTEHLRINSPFSDLKVVVEQDGRSDNSVTVTTPLRVEGKTAVFEHNRALTFTAGNEYRRFEVINDHYPGQGVEGIMYAHPFYHHTLYPDYPRADHPYAYDYSRHGRFLIRLQDSNDSDTEADYVAVHFTLVSPELPQYDIYIEGDITGRMLSPESLMTYDHDRQCYEKTLMLKHGAYGYQYVVRLKGAPTTSPALTAPIEGDLYPTRHEYTVKVYYRIPGERYDRLAGYTVIDMQ